MKFDGQVVIITGAGQGLGRAHALAFAERGAKIVVNDMGADRTGEGGSPSPANQVVQEIEQLGGEAFAHAADVTNPEQVADMVQQTMSRWGRVDVLVNNAGVLRDKTFAKMSLDDFAFVEKVHLGGTVVCISAIWEIMREQNYGRIVMTSSGSGLFGNFGQANYGAAKAAVVGLMNTLHLEGAKYNIRVNTLVPSAATRMTVELQPDWMQALQQPETVSPGVLFLSSPDAPSKVILGAGGGAFSRIYITDTDGIFIPEEQRTPEGIAEKWEEISDPRTAKEWESVLTQGIKYTQLAAAALNVKIPKI